VLVSLALPPDTPVDFVDELYKGMNEQIQAGGAAIVGGNLSRSVDRMVIDIFLMGQVSPEHLVLRKGAKEGDLIFVTGTPGDSRAGFELIQNPGLRVSQESSAAALERHMTPQPRLKEGQALARSGCVHAMVDVSDGLLADLSHICDASGVGAEVLCSDLPVSSACMEVARTAGRDPFEWALSGGEDYELLFTAARKDAPVIQQVLEEQGGASCRAIGRIASRSEGVHAVLLDGSQISKGESRAGWDHFTSHRSLPESS
jgi:thiamine-monophosphate kinase